MLVRMRMGTSTSSSTRRRNCFDGRRGVFRWDDPRRPPSSARKRASENRVERCAHCYFTYEWSGADRVAIAGGNEICTPLRMSAGKPCQLSSPGEPGIGKRPSNPKHQPAQA